MLINIPLDYMHLCCLGVMMRLLQLWCRRLKNVAYFCMQLLEAIPFIPMEFSRKSRFPDEIDRFKATEFRQLLFYTGLVILNNCLKKEHYIHYLCFSLAIRILVNKNYSNDLYKYAQEFLVKSFSKLYGTSNLSYNVHNLIHL